jgi:hypothetical protein
MYITRSEIERLFGTTTYFSEAYKDAESSLHNNIGDVYDLDTELRRTGSTRDVVIFTLFSHLISLNMALKGNKKIDSSKCFDIVVRIITELKIVQIVSGSNVTLDTSSFDKQLSGDDDTVQKALNTLDELEAGGGTGGGGFIANIYLRTDDSDVASYQRISYENETSETELSVTLNSADGLVLARTYLYDDPLETTLLDAGVYIANYRAKVSNSNGNTCLIFKAFVRKIDDSEITLFTLTNCEINNTTYETIRSENNQSSFEVEATDRFGVRIYVETTQTSNVTVNTIVGGEQASYFSTPIALRHNLLRNRNAEDAHPQSAITGLVAALDGKEDSLGFTPEDESNKKTDMSDNSDDYYASQKAVKTAVDAKQNNYTTESITISVADWSGGLTTTKTVTGVTATSFNSICADKDNSDLLGDFGVIGDSQDTDEITFKADETPTEDISLTVVIFS